MLEFASSRRRFLQLLVALFAIGAPSAALAQGPVQRFLQGGVADPAASMVYVEPPRGGMVMVYEGNRPVGVLQRAGTLSLRPGRVYGVVATRGSAMLFNQRLRLRSGFTSLVWAPGQSMPQMSFRPRVTGPRPGARARRSARAPQRPSARAPRRPSARAPRRPSVRAPQRPSARTAPRSSTAEPRRSGAVQPKHSQTRPSVRRRAAHRRQLVRRPLPGRGR